MTIEQLGSIGEIVGAVGVVLSLIYLAVQIRRNESTTRAGTTQALLSTSTVMLYEMSESQSTWLVRGMAGEELSPEEKVRKDFYFYALFSHFNNAYHQNFVGKLDAEIWEMFDSRATRNVSSMPDFDEWWDAFRSNFTKSFQDYIDAREKVCASSIP